MPLSHKTSMIADYIKEKGGYERALKLKSDFRKLKQDLFLFSQDEEEEDSLIFPGTVHVKNE